MSWSTLASAFALWLGKGAELLGAFGRWWLKELLALLPGRLADWLIERGSRTLVVAAEEDAVILRLLSDSGRLLESVRLDRESYAAEQIDDFLRSHRLRRRDVSLGLGLPATSVFCRSFALPLETRGALDAIVVQDLAVKTPFQLDAVFHAHAVRRTADRFLVSQWVVRRSRVEDAAGALGLDVSEVTFIEAPGARTDDGPSPLIALRQVGAGQSRWLRRSFLALAGTALVLVVIAIHAAYQRQQVILDRLDVEIAAARAKAKGVLAAINKVEQKRASLSQLRAMRSEAGLLDIWEEATRILPAHTWLSELRLSESLEGRQFVMTGFSAAAAILVGLVDRSPLFAEASLAGPVSMDAKEHKERFVIQASVEAPRKPRTASK